MPLEKTAFICFAPAGANSARLFRQSERERRPSGLRSRFRSAHGGGRSHLPHVHIGGGGGVQHRHIAAAEVQPVPTFTRPPHPSTSTIRWSELAPIISAPGRVGVRAAQATSCLPAAQMARRWTPRSGYSGSSPLPSRPCSPMGTDGLRRSSTTWALKWKASVWYPSRKRMPVVSSP